MKKIALLFAVTAAFISFNSCKKVEGPGGSSTIKGSVRIQKTVGGNTITYLAEEEDVYLVYGTENSFYDDDVKTSYDGTFEFNYLQKGDYKVFVYQDCVSCPSGKEAVIKTIEITENKSIQDLGEIIIKK